MKPVLPREAAKIITILNDSGFEAYAVGGCVRDILRGCEPHDWDVTTSATPDETARIFSGFRVINTGIKHGTVTVLSDGVPIEVTTYRIDGEYTDHRRPERVEFTSDLISDLKRRDFTINAMAYHPENGIIDCFGGQRDLKARRIVCVGDAEARFNEDALRVMRAVRFASVLGFEIEAETRTAMDKLAPSLGKISVERIAAELNKAIVGDYISDSLQRYMGVFTIVLPELLPMEGFDQHTKYHHLDVWKHTVETVKAIPNDLALRLVMLFHDSGKPDTFTLDESSVGHFYGHAHVSSVIADKVLNRLRYDNFTRNRVVYLIKHHCDLITPDAKQLKRLLNRMGEENLRSLIAVKRADCSGQAPAYKTGREKSFAEVESLLSEIIEQKQAFSLKNLAVNGGDLLEIGFKPGKKLGDTLEMLLMQVIDGQTENEKNALIESAKLWL